MIAALGEERKGSNINKGACCLRKDWMDLGGICTEQKTTNGFSQYRAVLALVFQVGVTDQLQ